MYCLPEAYQSLWQLLDHTDPAVKTSALSSCDLQIGSQGFRAAVSSMQLPMLIAKSLLHVVISAAVVLSPDSFTVKVCHLLQPALPELSETMEIGVPSLRFTPGGSC